MERRNNNKTDRTNGFTVDRTLETFQSSVDSVMVGQWQGTLHLNQLPQVTPNYNCHQALSGNYWSTV